MQRITLIATLALGIAFGALVAAPDAPDAPAKNQDPVAQAAAARANGWWTSDGSRLVFFAVLEGLYEDGVSQEIVDIIVPGRRAEGVAGQPGPVSHRDTNLHFIYTCPLCHPAAEAFLLYANRQPFFGQKAGNVDTFGSTGGLPPQIEKKLRSDKHIERLEGLKLAINRWVDRRLDLMQLQPGERKAWEQKIKALRDQGNAALDVFRRGGNGEFYKGMYAFWKYCPSCDGSAEGCKLEAPAHE